ncbi:hypothetical protein Nepgr_006716 [Nepenthes gracilis]|uniref:Uncharacterized protein n=1 Tax=Nepenthes gracilis TaxID=150966 RepID=A0AAD3XHV3_NEPGR|nr:hypothetical protein Nepgr_006716 [Nepenthes gracilis]
MAWDDPDAEGCCLECCFCMKWSMPLLMWEPYAGERWAATARLAWRFLMCGAAFVVWNWLQFWTGSCLPCPWISPWFNSATELLPSGKSIVTMLQIALVFWSLGVKVLGFLSLDVGNSVLLVVLKAERTELALEKP